MMAGKSRGSGSRDVGSTSQELDSTQVCVLKFGKCPHNGTEVQC